VVLLVILWGRGIIKMKNYNKFLIIIGFILFFVSVLSITSKISNFINNGQEINMTFIGNENITLNLSLYKNSNIISSYINLSQGNDSINELLGDGSDGELIFTTTTKSYGNLVNNEDYEVSGNILYLILERDYNFKNITLGLGTTLTSKNTSGSYLNIYSEDKIIINGTIILNNISTIGGGGGAGGFSNAFAISLGGSGGAGGINPGVGGSSVICGALSASFGNDGGTSSGGSGACGVYEGITSTSGYGGDAFGSDGGDGSCSAGGSTYPIAGGSGGGGAGGSGGKSGINLTLSSPIIRVNGLVNISGSDGNTGGNGGDGAHCGYPGSGTNFGGVGGNGGGGGDSGSLIYYSNNLIRNGIEIIDYGVGGDGGDGGENKKENNINHGYADNGTKGINGTNGTIIINQINTIENPYILVNNTKLWEYVGNFTEREIKTSDFSSILNISLHNGLCDCNGCFLDSDNCSINFTFHSDTAGILGISNLNITWNESILPNLTINQPSGEKDSTNITYNISVNDNYQLDYCTYWVTRGASLEISNTSFNCETGNTGLIYVSSVGTDYIFHTFVNDTFGNSNYSNSNFSISSGAIIVTPPSTGGGGGSTTVIIGAVGNWTMSSSGGGATFDFTILPGVDKIKTLEFLQQGTDSVDITMSCENVEGDLCKYVEFEKDIFNLPSAQLRLVTNNFIIKTPETYPIGEYTINLVGTDSNDVRKVVTATVTVSRFGIQTFIVKLGSDLGIFPYWIIYFLSIIGLSIFGNFTLTKLGVKNLRFLWSIGISFILSTILVAVL